jgi:glycosyltransferase involved in cell wall biosynthesis
MISIVTPSFRQLDWLPLAVASVADQGDVQVEHIIQDAGTDGIFERFPPQSSRPGYDLRVYVEQDQGMYDAVNRGLKKSHGEICCYLNCDEQYLPGALAEVKAFFDRNQETELLFSDMLLVSKAGEPLSYRRVVPPRSSHLMASHLNTSTCAMFFRRSLLESVGYFDTKWKAIGDMDWVYRCLSSKIRVGILRKPLAVFTFTGQNLGASDLSTKELELFRGGNANRKLSKVSAILSHRVSKLLAGAYRRRSVELSIYTQASPRERIQLPARELGFRWPIQK